MSVVAGPSMSQVDDRIDRDPEGQPEVEESAGPLLMSTFQRHKNRYEKYEQA